MIGLSLATEEDDAGIRRLLASTPMPGRIRVRFEREPSYFAGCAPGTQVLVARDGDRVVGVACRTIRKLFINGVAEDVGYLGQLRVAHAYRGRLLTARGYRVMRELHADGKARGYYTTIVDGNAQAEGVLVRKSRGTMPHYRFVEKLHTLAVSAARRSPIASPRHAMRSAMWNAMPSAPRSAAFQAAATPASSRHATREEPCRLEAGVAAGRMPALRDAPGASLRDTAGASCPNLFPAYPPEGEVVAVPGASAALHDQRAYKQTVIDGYARALSIVRPLYNLVGALKLPKPNTALKHAYVTHFQAEDARAARELIVALQQRASELGLDHILLGFTESDPFLDVARAFRPVEYTSSIYTVAFDDGDDFHERLLARPRALDLAAL